jgi:hypothetical protein
MATPHLGSRLPRQTFNELLDRYLGDQQPLEAVEDNSRQLLLFLQEHQQQAQATAAPAAAPPTLTNVAVLASAPAPATSPAVTVLEELLRRILEEQQRAAAAPAEIPFPGRTTDLLPTSSSHLDTVPNGQ